MKRIYLDHNATTPVDSLVLGAILPFLKDEFGNPSSIHSEGQRAKQALNDARKKVAECLGAEISEIMFTSCGSESDNNALIGIYDHFAASKGNHIVTTAVEHSAIRKTCQYLEKVRGAHITYLPVNRKGHIDIDQYKMSLRK